MEKRALFDILNSMCNFHFFPLLTTSAIHHAQTFDHYFIIFTSFTSFELLPTKNQLAACKKKTSRACIRASIHGKFSSYGIGKIRRN